MTLELFFLRHAIAHESGSPNYTEMTRPLTEEGIEKMILEAKGMKKLGIEFDSILSSPLTRAQQTAEIVKKHLLFEGKIETEILLAPGGSFPALLKKMRATKKKKILLVGHEPSLSLWIQELLGFAPKNLVEMKKGALCHLVLQGETATLKSFLPPRVLRQCAG